MPPGGTRAIHRGDSPPRRTTSRQINDTARRRPYEIHPVAEQHHVASALEHLHFGALSLNTVADMPRGPRVGKRETENGRESDAGAGAYTLE